ncbi:SRPBCC domain-containing protein [Pacificimonas sp. WHA3]|uniref:SRPBCC domain-containing protein n=1 Tax=Pacificimonas pallii TaxID=2827236 RepID=A0ABS6SHN1_9SPHN|nr:SRPBCC domain-containing protein [Pacificimonas pallii]MBV7257933.1 SRPBCC domain-containing protein [Pacificimonas pallii]
MGNLFKALSDETRRALLDLLRRRDGQTLSELVDATPGMTRFGVMKHLKQLEAAHLITSRKIGRARHHYLNAARLQTMVDRWIAPFGRPAARTMSDLKTLVEEKSNMSEAPPALVYELIIKTTPADLWDAMTNPERTPVYYFGSRIDTELQVGAKIAYRMPDGSRLTSGKILELVPEKKLSMSQIAMWEEGLETDPPTRETWTIEELEGGLCKLTVVHDGFDTKTATYTSAADGWPMILSGLKTYLETGEGMMQAA